MSDSRVQQHLLEHIEDFMAMDIHGGLMSDDVSEDFSLSLLCVDWYSRSDCLKMLSIVRP